MLRRTRVILAPGFREGVSRRIALRRPALIAVEHLSRDIRVLPQVDLQRAERVAAVAYRVHDTVADIACEAQAIGHVPSRVAAFGGHADCE